MDAGTELLSDEDFADCYDVTTGRPSVPPSRMFKLVLLQAFEDLSDRRASERMAFDLRWKAVLGLEVHDRPVEQATLVEFRARVQDTYNLIGSAVRKLLGMTARRQSRTSEKIACELGLVLTAPQESGSLKGCPEERKALLNELVQEPRQVLATGSREMPKRIPGWPRQLPCCGGS